MFKDLRINPSDVFTNDYQNKELKGTVVRGSMSLMVSQGVLMGFSVINTLVLARLLTPADFGVIGMVTVFISLLVTLKDLGLSTATIQNDKIEFGQTSTLFWINSLASLILGLIIFMSSPLIAAFYKKPELTAVTAALSFSFVITGFAVQHRALLQRHLKFTSMALMDIIANLMNVVVSILMAWLGYRYWALVGGIIARAVTMLVLTFYFCPWMPGRMKKGTGVRKMLWFGGHVTVSNIVNYLSRELDSILIGKFLGAEQLGLYHKTFTLLVSPLTQIKTPLNNLSLPVLSSLKNDNERYKGYFSKLLDISVSLALPLSVYCFLESEFVISVMLGSKWMSAVPVFRILSVAGMFISIQAVQGQVMLSYGYSKRYMRIAVTTAVIISVSFIAGIPFGILGVAVAYTVANFLILIPQLYFGYRDTPVSLKMVFGCLAGPIFAAAISGLLTYLFILLFHDEGIIKHILTGLIFAVIYVILTLMRPKTRFTIMEILRNILPKKEKNQTGIIAE